jgi:dephospho-CoA kinase
MRRKTVIVTGLIGSGKSAVCALLRERGIPVYDSDARTKGLYDRRPALVDRLEETLGLPLRGGDGRLDRKALAARIFSDDAAREKLEAIVYPEVLADFKRWKARQKGAPFVVLESAVILSKPVFDGLADAVVLVSAPEEVRLQRVMQRDSLPAAAVRARMAAQVVPMEKVSATLSNEGTPQALQKAVEQVFFAENSYICKILQQA